MKTSSVRLNWTNQSCIVVASGPSLTRDVALKIRLARLMEGWNVIAVNDAYRLLPHADVLYAADFAWWKHHNGVKEFTGQRWTSNSKSLNYCDDKSQVADQFDLNMIEGKDGNGFGKDTIHYGGPAAHSGFQAVNLAFIFGCNRIVLVGFDYGFTDKEHFFGRHAGLRNASNDAYREMAKAFDSVDCDFIVNATPGSNLKRFPFVELDEEISRNCGMHRHRAKSDRRADQIC